MAARNGRWRQWLLVPLIACAGVTQASDYNSEYCQLVANTLNFHWEAIAGPSVPCIGIEYTNGSFADAADGSITLTGVSVSDPSCIGTGTYTLALSADGNTLSGLDVGANVPMTLTRGPGEACFVGHWVLGDHDWVGHIAAAPFLARGAAIPALDGPGLLLLAGLLAVAAHVAFWRRRHPRVDARR